MHEWRPYPILFSPGIVIPNSDLSHYLDDKSPADRANNDTKSLNGSVRINDTRGELCAGVCDNQDTYNQPNLEAYPQLPLRVAA